jgi:hypothetical protein
LLKNSYVDRVLIWFYLIFAFIILISICNIFLSNNSFLLLSKQIGGIFLTAFVYFILFKINEYDVKKLFKIYLNLAFIVAIIGIIQQLSFLLNFKIGYDFSYLFPYWRFVSTRIGLLRVNSILPEPTHFAYVMIPAFFVSLVVLTKKKYILLKKWKSLIIIVAFLLTFSTVGYIGIFLALILLIYNYGKFKYLIFFGFVLFLFTFFLWNNVEEVKMRVSDSFYVLTGEKKLETVNLSTFALFSNALVTKQAFLNNPIFGNGLGSRLLLYDKYIGDVVNVKKAPALINREGGNSLFLRVLSELGLFGTILVFIFLYRFHLFKKQDKTNYLWIISCAVLIMFLLRLIRSEHYFNGGLFFFVWLYYFTWKSNNKLKINSKCTSQFFK